MQLFLPTLILRHRRENLKKCSLRGLQREDFVFLTYPQDTLPHLISYCLLTLNAPPLTPEDRSYGLLLIDGTWRYTQTMYQEQIEKPERKVALRSLPAHYQTAYPRRQPDCPDPARGLSSLEALFLAYHILKRPTHGILDNYYWKNVFLKKNQITE